MVSSLGSSDTADTAIGPIVISSVSISPCSCFISGTLSFSSLEFCDASESTLKFISGGGSTLIVIGSAGGKGGRGGKGGGVGSDVGSILTSLMFAFSSHIMASSIERPCDLPLVCSDNEFLRSVPAKNGKLVHQLQIGCP